MSHVAITLLITVLEKQHRKDAGDAFPLYDTTGQVKSNFKLVYLIHSIYLNLFFRNP